VNVIRISTLQQGQVAEVAALWNQAVQAQGEGYGQHRLSVQRLKQILHDQNYLPEGALVAEERGELIGFAMGYVQTVDFHQEGDLEGNPGRLAGIAVKPGHWRQGIGRKLLDAVETTLTQQGKTAVAFETFNMPISLVRGPYVDSGPYRFLIACGYGPLEHELLLRNNLEQFELTDEIKKRRERLSREGIEYRLYEVGDRENLREFMARCFPGAWYTIIQRATEAPNSPHILMAIAAGQIVGFMGPFGVDQPGEPGSFASPGVDPAFRGRGIGKVMFNLGLDYLKKLGATETTYSTGVSNPARFIYFDSGAELLDIFCCNFHKSLPCKLVQ